MAEIRLIAAHDGAFADQITDVLVQLIAGKTSAVSNIIAAGSIHCFDRSNTQSHDRGADILLWTVRLSTNEVRINAKLLRPICLGLRALLEKLENALFEADPTSEPN